MTDPEITLGEEARLRLAQINASKEDNDDDHHPDTARR